MKPPYSKRPGGGAGRPPSDRGPSERGPNQGSGGRAGPGGPQRHPGPPGSGHGGGQGSGQRGPGGPGGTGSGQPARHAERPAQPGRVYHSDGPQRDRPAEFRGPRPERGADRGGDRTRDRGPDRSAPPLPRGTLWLYGQHAVAAALGNPARRLRRLILTEEAEATLATRLPPPWPMAAERMDRAAMDRLLGRDAVHQGIALLADPLAPPQLAPTLERPGPILVLDQVTDPRNIGAILRCAAAFGVAGVITQDRNAPEETGAMAKAAAGALEAVPLIRAVNIARTLIALKAAGFWVVGLDAGGKPLAGPALADRRIALVLGAEGEGMRRLTRETCDEIAGLAMSGTMESLNVSAAAAVALYELGRRG